MSAMKTKVKSDDGVGKRVAVLAGGALLLGLLWWAQHSEKDPVKPLPAASTQASGSGTNFVPRTTFGSTGTSSGSGAAPLMPAETVRQALADYLAFAEFPPWSRPADGSQTHLWKWNEFEPVGQAFSHDAANNMISGSMVLDKMFANEGDTITATVLVWKGVYDAKNRDPIDAKVVGYVEAWRSAGSTASKGNPEVGKGVLAPWKPGQPQPAGVDGFNPVETVAFHSVGNTPQGHKYQATFKPSSMPGLAKQADVRFMASVDPGDDHPFPFTSPFRYAASPGLVVLDRHQDSMVEGNLQFTFAVDIKKLGPVLVQATLFDGAGTTPIAIYDNYYRPSQTGQQEITIKFFGKVLHDKNIDGPYSIRSLHGFVKIEDGEPPELFWDWKTPMATNAYKASDFSASEWDAPEKQEKINQYKALLGP